MEKSRLLKNQGMMTHSMKYATGIRVKLHINVQPKVHIGKNKFQIKVGC